MKEDIFIYIIGVFSSYIYTRYSLRKRFDRWDAGNRNFSLLMSLGSWLSVVVLAVNNAFDALDDYTSAKW